MSEHPTYNLSFTAASLRPELSRIVAEAYLSTQNWELAKAQILSGNALQCRSASSAVRLERELRQRLQRLTENQLRLLANAPAEDRAAMCWLAACKHIQFAFDFAAELLREKLTALDTVLWPSDYESFVQSKELSQPELRELAPSSKAKVRQVLLRMLLEAGLLVPGRALGNLQRPVLSLEVREAITSENPLWLAAFLVPENELPVR